MIGSYEHRQEPLLSPGQFRWRLIRHVLFALCVLGAALGIGMLGYHFLEDLPWLDAFLNAAMILGGMGPVDTLHTEAGKLFAGFYALFAGTLFLVVASLVLAPILHRLLHKFHLEDDSD